MRYRLCAASLSLPRWRGRVGEGAQNVRPEKSRFDKRQAGSLALRWLSVSTPSPGFAALIRSEGTNDHRLSRALHDRTQGPRPLPSGADRGHQRPLEDALAGVAQDQRRRDPGGFGGRAAQVPARARHRSGDLLAARHGDGPSHRRLQRQPGMVAGLQRADPPRLQALSGQFRRRVPIAADAGRAARQLRRGAGALHQRVRHGGLQPQSRSFRRALDRAALDRPLLVQILREAGRARRARHGACERVVQSGFHGTGAHYINADTTAFMQLITGRPVQGFPDPEAHHPAWRRRGAVPLGPLSRPRHD